MRVRAEVSIEEVKIINRSYATYPVVVKITSDISSDSLSEFKVGPLFKRYSEFYTLKRNLEKEFSRELPYELPGRTITKGFWSRQTSLDSDVIEERKYKLRNFLYDILNDSFDTRWRNSSYISEFLGLKEDWNTTIRQFISKNSNDPSSEKNYYNKFNGDLLNNNLDLTISNNWEVLFKECKSQLLQCKKNNNDKTNNKVLMQLRLVLNKLENTLPEDLQEKELDKKRRLLELLKNDVNELVTTSKTYNSIDSVKETQLFGSSGSQPLKKPILGRRKLGETEHTISLNNQQLLQLHKGEMQDQDKEIEQLQKIVQRQKLMTEQMNEELTQQNELLDMMDEEVNNTSVKLNKANLRVKRFNDTS